MRTTIQMISNYMDRIRVVYWENFHTSSILKRLFPIFTPIKNKAIINKRKTITTLIQIDNIKPKRKKTLPKRKIKLT